MIESRTKNATRNILYGIINKVITLILPFFTRTLILYILGASFLGIGTLFTSILSFLSLAELGIGSAICFIMYKPIADNDFKKIGSLLNYFRKLYRIVGFIILGIGTFLVPFIPYLIKGKAPVNINIYILYYLYLINSVISYFFAGYRQSLLIAHQRSDIVSKIATLAGLFIQFGQIIALYFTRNFYLYATVPIIGTILINISNTIITRYKYPNIICKGVIDNQIKNEIKKRLSGLFGTKLNSIVVHSADVMIISSYLGLTMTAQFGNYYYIMNAICGLIGILYSSMTAGIGNKLVKDSKLQNFLLFKNLFFVNAWIVGLCSVCFLCLYEPFMNIWVGEELCLGTSYVICLVLYFYIYQIQKTILTFKDAGGLWYEDRYRPYISMFINLVLNIILVQFIGIYGVVISTILAFFISIPWCNYIVFKIMFCKSAVMNLIIMLKYLFITSIIGLIAYFICILFPVSIFGIIERLCVCISVSNIIYTLLFCKTDEYIFFKQLLKNILKRKLI